MHFDNKPKHHHNCEAEDNRLRHMTLQGESKKSRPPTTFDDIFTWAESFCIKFCTFIGNLYPLMSTDFRLLILTLVLCEYSKF